MHTHPELPEGIARAVTFETPHGQYPSITILQSEDGRVFIYGDMGRNIHWPAKLIAQGQTASQAGLLDARPTGGMRLPVEISK